MAKHAARETTIGAVVDLLPGYPFKSEQFARGAEGIRLLRGDNVQQRRIEWTNAARWDAAKISPDHERYRLRTGDVVLAMDRPWVEAGLKVARLREQDVPALLVQRVSRLRAKPHHLRQDFLYYVLAAPDFTEHVLAVQTGTSVPHISGSQILDYRFRLPDISEQKAIAEVLGALDEKIELNRQMNHTLEEMAQALFKSWFVDFDPVVANAAGKRPFGMDAATATHFPGGFQPDGRPLAWTLRRAGHFLRVDKGVSYKGAFLSDAGKPMINLGCFLGRGRFRSDRIKGYAGEYASRHAVRPGDIVMANTDMTQDRLILGSPCIVPDLGSADEFLISHHVFALRVDEAVQGLKDYLVYAMQQPDFRERAEGFANGTTVLALPADAVTGAPLLWPGDSVLAAFGGLVQPWRELRESNERESKTLAALRDLLLPRLLSGEIRLKQAEKSVEAVL
jgi:type I restriction enzyme S subunit